MQSNLSLRHEQHGQRFADIFKLVLKGKYISNGVYKISAILIGPEYVDVSV